MFSRMVGAIAYPRFATGTPFRLAMATILMLMGLNLIGVTLPRLPCWHIRPPGKRVNSIHAYTIGLVFSLTIVPYATPVLPGILANLLPPARWHQYLSKRHANQNPTPCIHIQCRIPGYLRCSYDLPDMALYRKYVGVLPGGCPGSD